MIELLIRVDIDTSIWISALINPHGEPGRLMRAVRDRRIRLVLSPPLVAKVEDVLQRSRIRRRIDLDDDELAAFVNEARDIAVTVAISGSLRMARDPKDDLVVETAIVGGARYIVSRDEDLTRDLDLVDALRGQGINVMTVARFLELLDADQR